MCYPAYAAELVEHFTLLPEESALLRNKTGATRLGFTTLLKHLIWRAGSRAAGPICRMRRWSSSPKQVKVPAADIAFYDGDWRQIRPHRRELREALGWRPCRVPDAEKLTAWLAELAGGTAWEEDANLSIGPAIGLPRLPVAPMPGSPEDTELYEAYGPRFLAKTAGFVPWAQGRRFVWFEDEPEEKAAAARLASQPYLVIWVDLAAGLTRLHLDEAARWLLVLRARERPQHSPHLTSNALHGSSAGQASQDDTPPVH